MTTPRALTALLMLCAATPQAGAQTIHKCTLDGKVTYTEQPCAGGTVIAVPNAPAPASDKSAAAELKSAKKQADALEKDRHKREAASEREDAAANRAAAARHQKCDKLRLDKKWADEDLRRAQPQHEERARIKAQRAAEKLNLSCAS
ncbi:DUF4124 domain-containing protein [Massilia sp. Root418]|uniref:DUF4124 domain-containing protein n=1 Tax=Massilia sp. Root418 TaxID=1736532 RepID=UPI0009E8A284|nr:DUF4124 domain-containing protein [Massilia sp. Root418]